jgi:hypothetical protein
MDWDLSEKQKSENAFSPKMVCIKNIMGMQGHREGFPTIIINVTPSPWSRPGQATMTFLCMQTRRMNLR